MSRNDSSAREVLLKHVADAARANGGKPLGSRRFFREYGLGPKDLWEAGFESYGAACAAIDLIPNELRKRLTDDELLRPLALLGRKLGKFPPKGAVEVERTRTPSMPSWEAYVRRKKEGPQKTLVELLFAWCTANADFSDVAEIIAPLAVKADVRQPDSRQVVKGFVYLMRYGSGGAVFKIGISEDVSRRHAQIRMVTPQDVRVVHTIPTDDPPGIERYWHDRFANKVDEGKKELFRLAPEDVAAFRSRKYQ